MDFAALVLVVIALGALVVAASQARSIDKAAERALAERGYGPAEQELLADLPRRLKMQFVAALPDRNANALARIEVAAQKRKDATAAHRICPTCRAAELDAQGACPLCKK